LAEGAVAPIVMLRRGALKFVSSPSDPDQLYDLSADPNELENLASSPDLGEEGTRFRKEVAARWDFARLNDEVLRSQRQRRLIASALAVGEQTSWDYGDSAGPYVRGADFWTPFKRARLRRT